MKRDLPDEAPRHAYVESPFNLAATTLYAGLTGTAIGGHGTSEAQGGVVVGGSPVDRLSIHAFVGRDNENKWAPIATVHFRFLGSVADGYALGAFVQYKTDGFADAGGEVEGGLTFGLRRSALYWDSNLVGGVSTDPDEGEADAEARTRLGLQLADGLRLGVEAQGRRRLSGSVPLAGGRKADFAAGPQVLAFTGPVVIAATGGVTTMDVAQGVGGFGMVTVGAFTK